MLVPKYYRYILIGERSNKDRKKTKLPKGVTNEQGMI